MEINEVLAGNQRNLAQQQQALQVEGRGKGGPQPTYGAELDDLGAKLKGLFDQKAAQGQGQQAQVGQSAQVIPQAPEQSTIVPAPPVQQEPAEQPQAPQSTLGSKLSGSLAGMPVQEYVEEDEGPQFFEDEASDYIEPAPTPGIIAADAVVPQGVNELPEEEPVAPTAGAANEVPIEEIAEEPIEISVPENIGSTPQKSDTKETRAERTLREDREYAGRLVNFTGKLTLKYIKETFHVSHDRAKRIRNILQEGQLENVRTRGEAAAEEQATLETPEMPTETPPETPQEPVSDTEDDLPDIPSYTPKKLMEADYSPFITADLTMPQYSYVDYLLEHDRRLTTSAIMEVTGCDWNTAATLWRLAANEGKINPDGTERAWDSEKRRKSNDVLTDALIRKYRKMGYETDPDLPQLNVAARYTGAVYRLGVMKAISDMKQLTDLGIDEFRAKYIYNFLESLPMSIVTSDLKPYPDRDDLHRVISETQRLREELNEKFGPDEQPEQPEQTKQPEQPEQPEQAEQVDQADEAAQQEINEAGKAYRRAISALYQKLLKQAQDMAAKKNFDESHAFKYYKKDIEQIIRAIPKIIEVAARHNYTMNLSKENPVDDLVLAPLLNEFYETGTIPSLAEVRRRWDQSSAFIIGHMSWAARSTAQWPNPTPPAAAVGEDGHEESEGTTPPPPPPSDNGGNNGNNGGGRRRGGSDSGDKGKRGPAAPSPAKLAEALEDAFDKNKGLLTTAYKNDETKRKALVDSIVKLGEETYDSGAQTPADLRGKAYSEFKQAEYELDEARQRVEDKALAARIATRRIYNHPLLLTVEGQEVITSTKGKQTFTHIEYANDVTGRVYKAIASLRGRFQIWTVEVQRLIFVASGIGVGLDQKIAGAKPGEFKLYIDQYWEIARNIEYSIDGKSLAWEGANTDIVHPFRNIAYHPKTTNAEVRSGNGFLRIANKERIMPGYVPKSMLEALMREPGSPMRGQKLSEVQAEIMREWIEFGRPYLLARGEVDQVVGIENLMRAWMEMDNVDPDSTPAKISPLRDYATLNSIRAEMAVVDADDEDIVKPLGMRKDLIDRNLKRQHLRFNKPTDRKHKLSVDSPIEEVFTTDMERRRSELGDFFGCLSQTMLGAKALNLFILLTSPFESLFADMRQQAGLLVADAMIAPEVRNKYKITDKLREISRSPQWKESLSVLNKLYRIGGWGLVNAFMNEQHVPGNSGMAKDRNRFTQADLKDFMVRWGVYGGESTKMSEWLAEHTGIDVNNKAVLVFARKIADSAENVLLGSGLSETAQARFLMRLVLNEMGMAEMHKREHYDVDTLTQFARDGSNPENLFYSVMMTDAGQEAYMTLGIGGLGRKTAAGRALNKVLQQNRGVTFAFRTMFTRFVEYALAKATMLVPFSNTLAYLTMYDIKSYGEALFDAEDSITERAWYYTPGARTSFFEGLRKNLIYDTIMLGSNFILGLVIFLALKAFNIHPPEEEENLFTWSEWIIGDGENAHPIRLAWWLDDIVGISGPAAITAAILSGMAGDEFYYGERTEDRGGEGDSYQVYDRWGVAWAVFQNAMVTFNGANFMLDSLEMLNTYQADLDKLANGDVGDWDISTGDRIAASVQWALWDVLGDMTPTVIGQLFPGSKDFIGYTSEDPSHTAASIYDPNYELNEAVAQYRTQYVNSYVEFSRRRQAQTNVIMGAILNFGNALAPGEQTGYWFDQQPIETVAAPETYARFSDFFLDPYDPSLPTGDRAARAVEIANRAEDVDQYIRSHYPTPEAAVLDGFVLNSDMRVACIWHCIAEQEAIRDYYQQVIDSQDWDSETFYAILDEQDAHLEEYSRLLNDYYLNDDIPWVIPRYVVHMSDRETRFVDDEGHPATYFDYMRGTADRESYRYGGHNFLPWQEPNTHGTFHNFEPPIWNIRLDENGNAINDLDAIYDWTSQVGAVPMGRFGGSDVHELLFGGQGTNRFDHHHEALAIDRGDIPTTGERGLTPLETTVPDYLRNLDMETAAQHLGLNPNDIPEPDTTGTTGTRRTAAGPVEPNSGLSPFGTTLDVNYGPLAGSLVSVNDGPFDPVERMRDILGAFGHAVGNVVSLTPATANPYESTTMGENGLVWVPRDSDDTSGSDGWRGSRYGYGFRRYSYSGRRGSSGYNYNPKIYSVDQDANAPYAKTLGGGRQPYKATTTYLRPEFKTRGSSRPYSR